MTGSSFIAGFIGAFTGLVVYHLVIRPVTLYYWGRLKKRYQSYRETCRHIGFQRGRKWAWGVWGSGELTYNAMNGFFTRPSPFQRGVDQALKEIWPLEEQRRKQEEIRRRTA